MKSLLKDPDIAQLFENTFPNTLGIASEYMYYSWLTLGQTLL